MFLRNPSVKVGEPLRRHKKAVSAFFEAFSIEALAWPYTAHNRLDPSQEEGGGGGGGGGCGG